jgi:hypothetical protein
MVEKITIGCDKGIAIGADNGYIGTWTSGRETTVGYRIA